MRKGAWRWSDSAIGQAAEWQVWTHLTLSAPGCHVFLPLVDMGIDGIARYPGTDIARSVQVKERQPTEHNDIQLHIQPHELEDDTSLIIVVSADRVTGQLREHAYCIDIPTFCCLGYPRADIGGYQAALPYPPSPRSRWAPYAVRLLQLGSRVLPPLPLDTPLPVEPAATVPSLQVGYEGEMHLLSLLAAGDTLNVFKAFPDVELVEYCVRHTRTGRIVGIQVKTLGTDDQHPGGTIDIHAHTFRPTPATWFTIFAIDRSDHSLHPECLLIPSMEIDGLLKKRDGTHYALNWTPGDVHTERLAPYRTRTNELAHVIEERLPNL